MISQSNVLGFVKRKKKGGEMLVVTHNMAVLQHVLARTLTVLPHPRGS